MQELLSELPLSTQITNALTGKDNTFSKILNTLHLHETEPLYDLTYLANELHINIIDIRTSYLAALQQVEITITPASL